NIMTLGRKNLVALSVIAAIGLAFASCFLEPHPGGAHSAGPAPAVTVSADTGADTDYYQPLYYDGYPIFFSDAGLPYYYVNGAVFWIPSTYGYYGYYRQHWYSHRGHYNRWYGARGHRYRTYRRSAGYHRHPGAVRRHPGATRRNPGATRRNPGAVRHHPGATRRHPGATRRNPGAVRHHPGATRRHPGAVRHHPGATRRHPGATRRNPGAMRHNRSAARRRPMHPGMEVRRPAGRGGRGGMSGGGMSSGGLHR
ncbi:MAG: hypothetical protein ABI333_06525, partial [bacterium]